jgi:hypothetical protein
VNLEDSMGDTFRFYSSKIPDPTLIHPSGK